MLDGVGGDVARRAFELLEGGGRILSMGLASGRWVDIPADAARERGVTVMRQQRATPDDLRALTERALAEGAAGRLRPVVGRRFPLERAAAAHAAIEARATVGKTLEVGPAS